MTVDEAKELKNQLQLDIKELIEKFDEATGVRVNHVHVGIYETLSGKRVYRVSVDVEF